MDRIEFGQLTAGSLFKIGYFSLLGFVLPFAVVCGLLAMGGADTVQFNGRYIHGTGALPAAIGLGIVLPAIFAGLLTLGGLIMRIFKRLLPGLALRATR